MRVWQLLQTTTHLRISSKGRDLLGPFACFTSPQAISCLLRAGEGNRTPDLLITSDETVYGVPTCFFAPR